MSFLKFFLKPSNFPDKAKELLKEEEILFLTENTKVTVVYHRFKAAGKNFFHKKEFIMGSLCITKKSLIGYGFRKKIIHLLFSNDKARDVKYSVIEGKTNALVFAFAPSLFIPNSSGSIEIRYYFDEANYAYSLIQNLL